jgi:hypothetical protein
MQKHNIKRNFENTVDLGFKNLVVGGCSFTNTINGGNVPTTWPYYLRDLANIQEVFSCAVPGAGNYFISQSIIWGIETKKLHPDETLIVVMWSGTNREDEIFSSDAIDTDFIVRISDVYPNDGPVRLLQDSALRMRWRNNGKTPEYMVKDKVYEVTMSLWNTSY